MQIEIHNFRCIKNRTVKFPNSLTLIAGENGRGKSTILYALYWCLYGEKKNVTTFGKTTTKVKITFKDPKMIIERSKPPALLKVECADGIFENEVAQSYIDQYMGCPKEVFDVACYIRQKHKFSSLLTHSDSSSILENLTNKGNIDEIIEKIKNHCKYLRSEKERYEKSVIFAVKPVEQESPDHIVTEDQLSEFRNDIKEMRGRLNTVSALIQSHLEIKRKNSIIKEQRQAIEERIHFLNTEIKRYEKILNYDSYSEYFEAEAKYNTLRQSRLQELKKIRLQMGRPPADIQVEIDEIQTQIDLENNRKTQRQAIHKRMSHLYSSIKTGLEEIELPSGFTKGANFLRSLRVNPMEIDCPCCKKTIYYDGNNTYKKAPLDDGIEYSLYAGHKKMIDEFLSLSEQVSKIPPEIELADLYQKKGRLLEEYRKENNMATLEELKKNPGSVEKKLESFLEETKINITREDYEKGKQKYSVAKEMAEKYRKERESLKNDLRKLSPVLEEKSKELIEEKARLEEKLEDCEREYEQLTLDYGKSIRYNEYLEQMKIHREITDKNKSTERKIKKLSKDLDLATSILEKAERAAVDVSRDIIDLINRKAKRHIKAMFDYPIKVELESKDLKLKIGIKVNCKGVELADLDSLGGGEKERIELAFCLAINEIGNSKRILMFDESFSGVHIDAFIKSIEYIKMHYPAMPILVVSQHGYEGCFENILRI